MTLIRPMRMDSDIGDNEETISNFIKFLSLLFNVLTLITKMVLLNRSLHIYIRRGYDQFRFDIVIVHCTLGISFIEANRLRLAPKLLN